MGTKRLTRDDIEKIVAKSAKKLANKYPTHNGLPCYAYSAGYLESFVVSVIADLPAQKQRYFLELLEQK